MRVASASKHHPLHSRRRAVRLPFGTQRFLAAFEGLEGGFAIGASIIAGLSFAGMERPALIAAAIVGLIVNGFNASAVKYSSEHYLDQLDGREKKNTVRAYFVPAAIEFVSYFVISFIGVLPLLFFESLTLAVAFSVATTLLTLFAAGWWRGYLLHMSAFKNGLEASLLGGAIIAFGCLAGILLHT